MAGSVPYLSFDALPPDLNIPVGEFDSDRGLGVEAELAVGEPRKEVGLADGRVAYHHSLEQIVTLAI